MESSILYDVVGVGFGPANLALAVAMGEEAPGRRAVFFERQPAFAWHPGMLLDGARVQVSFLKDLVTLRNPCSRFSFLSFLRAEGRLDQFVNLEEFRPTRREFNAYLAWAAEQAAGWVRYESEVTGVRPVAEAGGRVTALEVDVRHPATGRATYRARNLVLAAGGTPRIPDGVTLEGGDRIFHSHQFLARIGQAAPRDQPYRFVVVGEGQSAAEVFEYLITRYPRAEVTAAMRGVGYRPMDDSPFVNEIFFPSKVDFCYGLAPEKRRAVLESLWDTNYSVVGLGLIERLYSLLYDARAMGRRGLGIMPFANLHSASTSGGTVRMVFEHLLEDRMIEVEADVLVLATGYTMPNPHPLLAALSPYLATEDSGRLQVTRDYRVVARQGFEPGVFLQGYCQDTHGISDTLLSIVATRSAEIVRALADRVEPQ